MELLDIFNVYMSCDNTSPNNICEYNKVLAIISTYINTHIVLYCIIGGDMNTNMIRIKSTNTISLNIVIVNKDMKLVITTCSNVIQFTYTGINVSRSLIDHFNISSNFLSIVCDYFTHDSLDNLSDHVPLFITCKISCNDLIIIDEPTAHVPTSKWKFANNDHIN